MTLVSIGDQVAGGTYRFHSRFNRAVNFTRASQLVSVVTEDIGPGPLNIVLCGLPAGSTRRRAAPLRVGAHTVVFEDERFAFADDHRYHSTIALGHWTPLLLRHNLSLFRELLRTTAHPKSLAFLLDNRRAAVFRSRFERAFARQAHRGAQQVFGGRLFDGVATLRGCGFGLTPSGDDFIAGLLIGLRLLQQTRGHDYQQTANSVFRAAKPGNLFSRTFLDLARRGFLFGRMKDLIVALVHGDADAVRGATGRLLAVGESSGADLATGFVLTVSGGLGVL
ncbi:MAG: DUF2877 domain-containing protein [Verrucomicrobiia bacterium]